MDSPNRLNRFSRLMLAAQAPGAQVKPFWLAINNNGSGMYVGRPAAVGVALRKANVMAELG